MKVRYRETGQTDQVELRHDEIQGPVLVGHGDPFWVVGCGNPCHLETDAVPDLDEPYFIGRDTFAKDWELVEASDAECARLHAAGFRV